MLAAVRATSKSASEYDGGKPASSLLLLWSASTRRVSVEGPWPARPPPPPAPPLAAAPPVPLDVAPPAAHPATAIAAAATSKPQVRRGKTDRESASRGTTGR